MWASSLVPLVANVLFSKQEKNRGEKVHRVPSRVHEKKSQTDVFCAYYQRRDKEGSQPYHMCKFEGSRQYYVACLAEPGV